MTLPSASKQKVFQTSPRSDSYPLSLKASCFFRTQLFMLLARRNGKKLFRDANLQSLWAHIYLRACPSALEVIRLIFFHTHFTPLHPRWHHQRWSQFTGTSKTRSRMIDSRYFNCYGCSWGLSWINSRRNNLGKTTLNSLTHCCTPYRKVLWCNYRLNMCQHLFGSSQPIQCPS